MARLPLLPNYLINLCEKPPAEGDRNSWLFKFACGCRGVLTEHQLRPLMYGLQSLAWGREIVGSEIERAIANGFLKEATGPGIPWPMRDEALISAALKTKPCFDVTQPLLFESEFVIDRLFPGGDPRLLCAGMDKNQAVTADREEWRGRLPRQSFIVPGTMSKPSGISQDGRPSARCRDNAPNPRTYIVAECDDPQLTLKEKAALLTALAEHEVPGVPRLPLVLVVWSGAKSLHGWFRCGEFPEEQLMKWAFLAVKMGHDKAMWKPEQFFRMPGGTRFDRGVDGVVQEIRQDIFFFNQL